MCEIKCLDGTVFISKDMLDKSELLRSPGGLVQTIPKDIMMNIVMAASPNELLRFELPESIDKELLYTYFPYTRPVEKIDPKKVEKELDDHIKEIANKVKMFTCSKWYSCCRKKNFNEYKEAEYRHAFLKIVEKIPGASGVEKQFRCLNKNNNLALIRDFEKTDHLVTKLYEELNTGSFLDNQKPKTTLKPV